MRKIVTVCIIAAAFLLSLNIIIQSEFLVIISIILALIGCGVPIHQEVTESNHDGS